MAENKDEKKTKKPAAKKATEAKKPAAKKAPAKSAAKKSQPKKEAPKKVKPTTEVKQTQDEIAESKKGNMPKSSTQSTKAAKKSAEAKAKAVKNIPKGKVLTVTQIGSPIGRQAKQRAILIGLGLNKMYRTRQLEDTPSVRGMIRKVRHLVAVEEAA